MSAQHTFGRLVAEELDPDADYDFVIRQIDGDPYPITVAEDISEANARRLVACWNACLHISDPENVVPRLLSLNERVPDLQHQAATLRVQRDELLAALKDARRWIGDGECSDGLAREHWTPEYCAAVDRIDAAIAKVEGGAA